jgi:hypothetical protein
MIAHVSIGVRDIDRSKRFYDVALEPLGYKCVRAARSFVGYGYGRDSISFGLVRPSARFQPTKNRVSTSALRLRMLLPSMRFTRRRCGQVGMTTARRVFAQFTVPTTTPPSSSIRTDTASRRIMGRVRRDGCSDFKLRHPWRGMRSRSQMSGGGKITQWTSSISASLFSSGIRIKTTRMRSGSHGTVRESIAGLVLDCRAGKPQVKLLPEWFPRITRRTMNSERSVVMPKSASRSLSHPSLKGWTPRSLRILVCVILLEIRSTHGLN